VQSGASSPSTTFRVERQRRLADQVVAKYGLEKVQAQRDVDALLKGRHIWC
jgi:hypothetical protein